MENNICNGNKCTYGGGYIGLPVEINGLPETILIEGKTMYRKSSFHVSLLCIKDITEKYDDLKEKIVDFFCSFVSKNEVSFIKYTGEFRFATRKERETVVALCEISNLRKFSEALGHELGIEIPPQPTHVTLYTLQPDAGIGLNSTKALDEMSVPIQVSGDIRLSLGLN
jgi:hypothetical protein